MKRILLYYKKTDIDRRIFPATDYNTLWQEYGNLAGNSGNKLFIQACEQYLTKQDIEVGYLTEGMTNDFINQNFDRVVFPTANIFNERKNVLQSLNRMAEQFEQIKIPIIVLGAGAQADCYDDLDSLANSIEKESKRFIQSVYQSGGEFSLRGYFTKELFDKWGFKSACVTGCPSMYQRGRNLSICKRNVKEIDFKPSVNGELKTLRDAWWIKQFKNYRDAIYVDQSLFYDLFYNKAYIENHKPLVRNIKEFVGKFSETGLQLIKEGRVRLFYDIPVWSDFFQRENIDFSIGERIHGNLIALLNGVPAVVCPHDTRTRELAEFFEIPMVEDVSSKRNIYEIYEESSYDAFNKNFASKFDNFEKFLVEQGVSYELDNRECFEQKVKEADFQYPTYMDENYLKKVTRIASMTKPLRQCRNVITKIKN